MYARGFKYPRHLFFAAISQPLGVTACALMIFPKNGWVTQWGNQNESSTYHKFNMVALIT